MSDSKLLQEALESDIFDSREVSEKLNMVKKNKVKNIHTYEITQTKGKDSRWQTYVIVDGSRKKLTSTSENGLYDKLYKHYFDDDKFTLKSLFPQWIELRRTQNTSDLTVRRNINHWDKYYLPDAIINISLTRLTPERIEAFLYDVINKYKVTVKELNNMKFILKDILKMAKRRGIISNNPFDDVQIKTTSCRNATKHSETDRVYQPEEKNKLFSEIRKEINLYPSCTVSYGIVLLFKTGLRIGELVALKWSDIDVSEHTIHVRRMETRTEDSDGFIRKTIVEHTKKNSPHGDRFVPIDDYSLEMFECIRKINETYGFKEDDFIFCGKSGRIGIRAVDNRIRKLCNRAGIKEKSAHDIRRTVASELYNKGVNVEIIRGLLGHSDTKTTYGYIYNVEGAERTKKLITKALSDITLEAI